MLSKDIKNLADQFSYYVENHCSVTLDMSHMVTMVRQLRSFQNQAEALEHAEIGDWLKQSEISEENNSNVIILDNFRNNQNHTKTTA